VKKTKDKRKKTKRKKTIQLTGEEETKRKEDLNPCNSVETPW